MSARRERATATLLTNGKILVAGGHDGTAALSSTELYDPTSEAWSAGAPLLSVKHGHAAVRLSSGRVLVAGLTSPGAQLYAPRASPDWRCWWDIRRAP